MHRLQVGKPFCTHSHILLGRDVDHTDDYTQRIVYRWVNHVTHTHTHTHILGFNMHMSACAHTQTHTHRFYNTQNNFFGGRERRATGSVLSLSRKRSNFWWRECFVCVGILVGLLYIWWRGYILCVQAFCWVCCFIWWRGYILCVQAYCRVFCLSDGEGMFFVCRHSGVLAVCLREKIYFMCAGHFTGILLGLLYIWWRGYILCVLAFWWVCCISDGEGILFCWVCCISDREGIFCVCRSLGRHTGGFAVYQGTPETSDGQLYTASFRFVFTFTLFTVSW